MYAMSVRLAKDRVFGSRAQPSGSIFENCFEQHAREGSSGLTALRSQLACWLAKTNLPLERVVFAVNTVLTMKTTMTCASELAKQVTCKIAAVRGRLNLQLPVLGGLAVVLQDERRRLAVNPLNLWISCTEAGHICLLRFSRA